ncbi:glycine betaine ABC transporter substrate-binding protein [Streptomyces cavernicola]|uniref:Glycine betaine ABC transporter substrate-binding protein n=1 Tax=Streptomyces cavernicola TaxID=3043613 RepID=A0ABT6SCS4_9ACTN|nr:glycine betaine ABC transporter substrate-binding protein [Streptomyces sp. B-S-A6]MDI3405457.1 glycine betaine ABC transporter substrate-binding protein [Streptomyces sp. B-S-A6]
MKPSKHSRNRRIANSLVAGAGVLGVVALSGCAAETGKSGGSDEVTITVPSWVGAQANAEVAKVILEDELDVKKVNLKTMDEPIAWDALNNGKADAILEDWDGQPEKQKLYLDDGKGGKANEDKHVVKGGDLGVVGHIGWFIPKYYADKHPEAKTYEGLNKLAKDFKTSESGDKGEFLGAAPSYTTYDEYLIKNHKLNFKVKETGNEAAQIKEIQQKYKNKQPFITYWWDPQWLNNDVELVEVKLPEFKEGCNEPAAKTECGYANTPLQKYLNEDFAKNGGDAAEFLKNFKWTTEQQNEVAKWIAKDKMSGEQAAKKWVKENKDVWQAWLPKK